MTTVTIEVTQRSDPVDPWIGALEKPDEWLEPVSAVIEEDIAERWSTRTDPWGSMWEPVSETTLLLRAKGGRASDGYRGATGWEVREGGRRIVVWPAGAAAWKSRFAQWGAPDNRMFGGAFAPIPPRAFLPLRGIARSADFSKRLKDAIMFAALVALRRKVESLLRSTG